MLNILVIIAALHPRIDIGVGSAVFLNPLKTQYPNHDFRLIAKDQFTLLFLTTWFTKHYGVEVRYEGTTFGSFFPEGTPQLALFFLYKSNNITFGMGPFYSITEVDPTLPPEDAWKNTSFGIEWMIAKNGIPLWRSFEIRPWFRLGYINFLMTTKENEFGIIGFNELRNIFSIDLGLDVVVPVLRR